MNIKFRNWFRNKHSWWFAILPEATITYGSLGGWTTVVINIGWLFWAFSIKWDNLGKVFTQKKGGEQ